MTVRYHPIAEVELGDAALYYEAQQAGLGEQFISAVSTKLAAIAANPQIGTASRLGFREILADKRFPYLIVYFWDAASDEIFISAIFHTKRYPGQKFRKR